jgi:hypothetical protein
MRSREKASNFSIRPADWASVESVCTGEATVAAEPVWLFTAGRRGLGQGVKGAVALPVQDRDEGAELQQLGGFTCWAARASSTSLRASSVRPRTRQNGGERELRVVDLLIHDLRVGLEGFVLLAPDPSMMSPSLQIISVRGDWSTAMPAYCAGMPGGSWGFGVWANELGGQLDGAGEVALVHGAITICTTSPWSVAPACETCSRRASALSGRPIERWNAIKSLVARESLGLACRRVSSRRPTSAARSGKSTNTCSIMAKGLALVVHTVDAVVLHLLARLLVDSRS